MLSIGKVGMARGQQLYYEEQVAKGREDYYAGRGEAPGRWTGRGADALALRGDVDVEQLKAMMDGRHPATGDRLAPRSGNVSTAAIDMTFSAPKSVSVLFAVGDEELSAALVAAHEEAVDAAVVYMEQEACLVRRGHNGTKAERDRGDPRGWERARSEPARGFVAAAYRHRMSRAQDPQLHTHVVAANMAQGTDGRWTALDARHIYEHAKAGGAIYQGHLRHAVRERLPWASWGPVRNGMAELEQVAAGVLEEFSTRRRRVLEREAELIASGVAVGDAGRARIALDTRQSKREIEERDWRIEVRARAAEHGLGEVQLGELARLDPAAETGLTADDALASELFGPSGLTATRNTFARRDAVFAIASARGQGATAGEVQATVGRMLADARAVRLPAGGYTTGELVGAERRIVAYAEDGRGRHAAVLPERDAARVLAGLERPLTEEQSRAVMAITGSGNRIDTVEALAGTGKTTSAAALRGVYEHAGFRVIGAAPTGRAVRELSERAGIGESRTLDAWSLKLAADPEALSFAGFDEQGRVRRVPAVMVIDEAGMAHTRLSAQVIDAAMHAHVKVVAIGDSGQLSAVRAGGWLGALTRRLGSHELREVMRQHDPLERRGLARLHRGRPDEYIQHKQARGQLRVFGGEHAGLDAELAAVQAWASARHLYGADEAVLICRDNVRRERLNHAAREHLRRRGELGEAVTIMGREWAVGDRVIARRNDRGRDLDNGMRATITAVDQQHGLTVQLDSGDHRQFDPEYAGLHVEHAYALTGHGMQGGTVQWAAVIGQPGDFTRNWSYTALSRARQPTEILVVDEPSQVQQQREEIAPGSQGPEPPGPLARLARRMRERDDEDLALEQLHHADHLASHRTLDPQARAGGDQGSGRRASRSVPEPARSLTGGLEASGQSTIQRLAAVDEQLAAVNAALSDPSFEHARMIASLRLRAQRLETAAAADKPKGIRGRAAHRQRTADVKGKIHKLRERELEHLAHVPDPESALDRAQQLRERQAELLRTSVELHDQAVREELARRPPWLEHTLGPEPEQQGLRRRWQRTAREIASHRIDHDITDPLEIGVGDRDHALVRSITDTRAALGLDRDASRQYGRELD